MGWVSKGKVRQGLGNELINAQKIVFMTKDIH